MLHGKGEQKLLTESYYDDREKILKDRSKYSDEILEAADLDGLPGHGGGRTDPGNFEIYPFPFPMDQKIRRRQKIDIRKADKRIGD